MTSFVLDASMALAWHFPDELSRRSTAVAALSDSATAVVPAHWFAEIANGLLIGERRLRTTSEERVRFVDRIHLMALDVEDHDPARLFDVVLPLARAHGLTVCDTLYLELAERRGLPLASLDDQLNAAAKRVGIALVEEAA